MPSLCFYFQVHQPFRVRTYPIFHVGRRHDYFDETKNREVFLKILRKCYLPTNRKLLELIRRFNGAFRISFSISGVAIEQMQEYAPEVLDSFRELAQTGCVEFLAETYYHTLSFLFDRSEFEAQIEKHRNLIEKLFGRRPTIFRNTELIYADWIGDIVADLGFQGALAEGADDILQWRNSNFVYEHPTRPLRLLLKNYRLSDDIAFRFSNQGWSEWPLTAPKFSSWIHNLSGNAEVVNLFMDYETFGEHQWEDKGIFEFLDHLPQEILKNPEWKFQTPREVVETYSPKERITFSRLVSWADVERDLSAWNGNQMQQKALREIYDLGHEVRKRNNPATLNIWRKLQTSDHFYYMCTKWFADGDVHAYFSPFKSPYEAFLSYMNILTDFRLSVLDLGEPHRLGFQA